MKMSFRIVNVSFGIFIVFSIFVNKLIDGYGLDTHNVAKRMDLESCIGDFFKQLKFSSSLAFIHILIELYTLTICVNVSSPDLKSFLNIF